MYFGEGLGSFGRGLIIRCVRGLRRLVRSGFPPASRVAEAVRPGPRMAHRLRCGPSIHLRPWSGYRAPSQAGSLRLCSPDPPDIWRAVLP